MERITAEDPKTQSKDVVAENIAQLETLFPEAFTEGKVDFEVLKQLLGGALDEREEKYGLNWHGKRRARQLALTPSTGTLRPCPEDSVDWDTTQNLMIEGDNLEVLKLLQKSYAGKVKLIYIDPPYNTGNDFIYPDNFQDRLRTYLEITGTVDGAGRKVTSNPESSGRFHTSWLVMMYPRLKVARSLLSDDGVIVVSIDEHELFNLRQMLDELLGGENLVGELCVSLNPKGRQLSPFFATSHEYIVVYAKNIDECVISPGSTEAVDATDFPLSDDQGSFRLLPLRNTNKKFNPTTRPNLYFPLHVDEPTGAVSLTTRRGSREIYPVFGDGSQAVWRWSKPKVDRQSGELYGRLVSGREGDRWDVFQKDYLTEGRTKKLKTVWLAEDVGSTDSAVEELKSLIGPVFQTAKPTSLIRRVIRLMPQESTILDFFAGSGTTGHAAIAQNAADNGTRRHIMVQLPQQLDPDDENQRTAVDFCDRLKKPRTITELTKERLRRAAKKIKDENPMFSGDLGFRVFKLDSSNIRAWEPDRDDLPKTLENSVEHLETDRTETDVLYELLLKLGLDLCVPIEQKAIVGKAVHSIGGGVLFACLAEKLTREDVEPLAQGIVAWQKALAPAGDTTCVFRDSAFADDVAKTNLAAILNQHGLTNVRSL